MILVFIIESSILRWLIIRFKVSCNQSQKSHMPLWEPFVGKILFKIYSKKDKRFLTLSKNSFIKKSTNGESLLNKSLSKIWLCPSNYKEISQWLLKPKGFQKLKSSVLKPMSKVPNLCIKLRIFWILKLPCKSGIWKFYNKFRKEGDKSFSLCHCQAMNSNEWMISLLIFFD